ncbi:MAG: polyprenyl synthetase family protein [Deltaproteobacteria bacterium]|jgi:farnesyl diphosphate synthase|nr:polyprenyl synthetase family protein [Deltaproteobacteria bacterium]
MTAAGKPAAPLASVAEREDRLFERWRVASAARVTRALERKFARLRAGAAPEIVRLLDAMEWTLLGGGKRLRPLLALAAAHAVCGDERLGMPGALAVELLHTYSLVHDDLPDMDNDSVRRGRPAVHARFGPALGILAGDALQSLAFEVLSEGAAPPGTPQGAAAAAGILARAAGPLGMAGGQAEDLAFEGRDPGEEERSQMARRKTGEMIAASLTVGAALGGATRAGLARLRRAGLLAGEAFQIRDDLLNREGDPQVMGKAAGSDERRGKSTLLARLGADGARKRLDLLALKAERLVSPFVSPRLDRMIRALSARSF